MSRRKRYPLRLQTNKRRFRPALGAPSPIGPDHPAPSAAYAFQIVAPRCGPSGDHINPATGKIYCHGRQVQIYKKRSPGVGGLILISNGQFYLDSFVRYDLGRAFYRLRALNGAPKSGPLTGVTSVIAQAAVELSWDEYASQSLQSPVNEEPFDSRFRSPFRRR